MSSAGSSPPTSRGRPVDAVTFDLWATLIGLPECGSQVRHRARVAALGAALADSGQPADATAIEQVMELERHRYERVWRVERRTLLNHERTRWMTDRLGRAPLHLGLERRLCQALDDSLFEAPPELAHDAVCTVKALHAAGYTLGVVSDTSFSTGRAMRRFLANAGILGYFEALVFSDEIGHAKPGPEPFRIAAQGLGVAMARIAHVGDNLETDVQGARAAGLVAVWYHPQPSSETPNACVPDITIHELAELTTCL